MQRGFRVVPKETGSFFPGFSHLSVWGSKYSPEAGDLGNRTYTCFHQDSFSHVPGTQDIVLCTVFVCTDKEIFAEKDSPKT